MEKWDVEKVFSHKPKPVTRELIAYIKDREKPLMKKQDQLSYTRLLANYAGIFVYNMDIGKRYSIDDGYIHLKKIDML